MPRFILESGTIPKMMYNLKGDGGAKLDGVAEVEVVYAEKKEEPKEVVDNQTNKVAADMLQYVEYAMNRVENS